MVAVKANIRINAEQSINLALKDVHVSDVILCSNVSAGMAILENAKSFLPKSFNEAPMWYTTSSMIRKRSCTLLQMRTSIGGYWAL